MHLQISPKVLLRFSQFRQNPTGLQSSVFAGFFCMVESGLGISILPELILRRVPYHIVAKELDVPAYRKIGIAMRSRKSASLAVKRFLEYLQYR